MSTITLYHGSPSIIEHPCLEKGKPYNDYGQGFYCTKNLELAKEWACTENIDGYANQYHIESDALNILNLSSDRYHILHWLALLLTYRKIRLSTPIMEKGAQWITDRYLIDISEFDAIIGYRADDSYFSFARAFVNNEISLEQLSYAMKLGELGEQFVLKSPLAFDLLQFVSAEIADNSIYYAHRKSRDEHARTAYFEERGKASLDGIFIRDLIRGEVSINEAGL